MLLKKGKRRIIALDYLEFKNPSNLIYIIIPIASLCLFILGIVKKERIIALLKLNIRTRFKIIRIIMVAVGLTLIFISLLGPQTFEGFEEIQRTGLDIYVLIDISKSMLTEDIQPNRIERAKKIIEGIIDKLEGDRIGFIPYSSSAYIQMPLTDDYELAKMFLDVIDTDMIGGGGTNAGTALKLASESFKRTANSDKVIIILSDGEEHSSDSIEVLKSVKDENLRVYTVGIGTDKGGLIPIYDDAGRRVDYKKDSNGEYVMSKLNRSTLQELAAAGKGAYYQSTGSKDEINSLAEDISNLKRDTFKTDRIRRFKQLYQYFLAAGIICIAAAYFLPEGRNAG